MLLSTFCVIACGLPSTLALVKNEVAHLTPQQNSLPRNNKVVILFRGQTFRTEVKDKTRSACDERSREFQLNNSISFLEKVIEPLEKLGNKVDVIITDEPCSLTSEVSEVFGKRVLMTKTFWAGGQSQNMFQALDALNETCGGTEKVHEKYDYVFIFRHDLRMLLNVDDWNVDWSTINFFARCEEEAGENMGGKNCVWDVLHLVPGRLYDIFHSVMGYNHVPVLVDGEEHKYSCFNLRVELAFRSSTHGHACYYPLLDALSKAGEEPKLGFIVPDRFRVRIHNDYLEMPIPRTDLPEK